MDEKDRKKYEQTLMPFGALLFQKMSLEGPAYLPNLRLRDEFKDRMEVLKSQLELDGSTMGAGVLDGQRSLLESFWRGYQDANLELVRVLSSMGVEEMEPEEVQLTTVLYGTIKAMIKSFYPPEDVRPRISEIKLSVFTGKYTKFSQWSGEFKSRVINTKLKPSQKIDLLMEKLGGEAKSNVGRPKAFDEEEFNRLFGKLTKTYDNKYQQIMAHMGEIFNVPQMERQSADDLRLIIDTVDEHVRHLLRHNIGVEFWKPMIFYIVMHRLDNTTRGQWDLKPEKPLLPDLDELFKFMEERIIALRNADNTLNFNLSRRNNICELPRSGGSNDFRSPGRFAIKRAADARVEGDMSCPCCKKEEHVLGECAEFRAFSDEERRLFIRSNRLCNACLQEGHFASACEVGPCSECGDRRHHRLLCLVRKGNGRDRTN